MLSRSFALSFSCIGAVTLWLSASVVAEASTPDKSPAKTPAPAAKPAEPAAKPTAQPEAKAAAKPDKPKADKAKPAKNPKVAADAAPPAAEKAGKGAAKSATKNGAKDGASGAAVGAGCEIKAGTGVEAHALQGEGTSFPAGSKVWAWSRINGQAGKVATHVWKHEGKVVRTARLPVKQASYSTNSRATVRAGSYVVECTDADGKVLGSVSFSVAKP